MPRHDINRLERQIKGVQRRLALLANDDETLELIRIIRQPGWTTPAEFLYATSIVTALDQHVKVLAQLKTNLLEASREVSAGIERKAA